MTLRDANGKEFTAEKIREDADNRETKTSKKEKKMHDQTTSMILKAVVC